MYIHFDIAQKAALVVNDMGLCLPVKNGLCLEVVVPGPDGVTRRVDGHCADVCGHVHHKQQSSQLDTAGVRESHVGRATMITFD